MLGENQSLEEEEGGREGVEEKKEENIKKSENENKHVRTRREPATRGRGTGKGKRRLRGEKGGKYKEKRE